MAAFCRPEVSLGTERTRSALPALGYSDLEGLKEANLAMVIPKCLRNSILAADVHFFISRDAPFRDLEQLPTKKSHLRIGPQGRDSVQVIY